MQPKPPERIPAAATGQIYHMKDTDGVHYYWLSTFGKLLAEARGEIHSISLMEVGITIATIRAQYEGMDEKYALTTDLSEPLLFVPHGEEVVLIDGWHRLARAALTGVDILPAYFLTQTEADLILLGKFPHEVDITTLCRL